MADKAVVICTGQPGTGRDLLLRKLGEKQDFFHHHLFDYIVKEAEKEGYTLNKRNVLDFYDGKPDKLEAFRAEALKRIINETPAAFKFYRGLNVTFYPNSTTGIFQIYVEINRAQKFYNI